MDETSTTETKDEERICSLLFLRKHQLKFVLIILLSILLLICLILFFIVFRRPISIGTTSSSKSQLLTTESTLQQNLNTFSVHQVSSKLISKSIPLLIMTFNIQYYFTSKTTKPIEDFILSEKADVVCLQENFYISDWNLTTLTALNLKKEYFLASDCQAEEGKIKTHLSNTIYVRKKYFNFTQTLSNVNLTISDETVRCSSVIQLYDTKIANLHLCGGRFDDKKFEKFINHKHLQLKRLIDKHNPDIILGDFNNENSEEEIMKQLDKYPFYQGLKPARKKKFVEYFFSGTRYLGHHTSYLPAYNESTIGSTSRFGGTPDWVYVKNQTRLTGRINNYDTISMKLSDHKAVRVEYLFSNENL